MDLKIIGGIKAGVKTFIYPMDNEKDYHNFIEKYREKEILEGITFHPVSKIKEVFDLVFTD